MCLRSFGGLRYQSQARGFAHPGRNPGVAFFRPFEVFQILLEGFLVELRQEIDGNRGIVLANLINELTFVHVRNTFKMKPLVPTQVAPSVIGYSDVQT